MSNGDTQVFVDSDAFVGLFFPADANHKRAKQLYQSLKITNINLFCSNLVVGEVTTVLSHKSGQSLALNFLEFIKSGLVKVIHVNEEIQEDAINLFTRQSKKGTSFNDCANAIVAYKLRTKTIFSFDKFYPKVGLKLYSGGNLAKT